MSYGVIYSRNTLIVQATVVTIVNYDRNMFIVQATDFFNDFIFLDVWVWPESYKNCQTFGKVAKTVAQV
jgi:hypothetical protein